MTTIKISDAAILKFDGEVLDIFPHQRIHVSQLKIELAADRHGKHTLNVGDIFSSKDISVDENAVQKINLLIAEVQKAKAEFKFD